MITPLPKTRGISAQLTKFFKRYPEAREGCVLRRGPELGYRAPWVLIIEESTLYHYLNGEYGWEGHTYFMECMTESPLYEIEMLNSCMVGYYKR